MGIMSEMKVLLENWKNNKLNNKDVVNAMQSLTKALLTNHKLMYRTAREYYIEKEMEDTQRWVDFMMEAIEDPKCDIKFSSFRIVYGPDGAMRALQILKDGLSAHFKKYQEEYEKIKTIFSTLS